MSATATRTAPSLALEAAALAYAAAVAALEDCEATIVAEFDNLTSQDRRDRLAPHLDAVETADRAMGRAAVALWKAERRRGAGVKP